MLNALKHELNAQKLSDSAPAAVPVVWKWSTWAMLFPLGTAGNAEPMV